MPDERQMVPEAERSDQGFPPTEHDRRRIPSIARTRFSRAERGEQPTLFAAFLSMHLKTGTRDLAAPFTELAARGAPASSKQVLDAEQEKACFRLWQPNEGTRPRPPLPLDLRPAEWAGGPPYDAA